MTFNGPWPFVANVNALCTPSLREVSSEAQRKGTHHLISTHRSRFGACNRVLSSNKNHPSLSHTFKRILPRGGRGDGPVGGLTSHPKEISTHTKAAFVYCHLAAITARRNSFFSGPHQCVNGCVGCEKQLGLYTGNGGQRLIEALWWAFLAEGCREQWRDNLIHYN